MEKKDKFFFKECLLENKGTKEDEESQINNFNDDNIMNSSNIQIIDDIIYKKDKQVEINEYKNVFNDKEYKLMFNILDYLNDLEDLYDNSLYCHKETKIKSMLGKKISINYQDKVKIFKITKERRPIYRKDYYLKKFKTHFFEYLLKESNNKLNVCKKQFNFDIKYENIKFHMPNHKLYQENTKEKDNKELIKKTWKDILIDYDKNIFEGTSGQRNNEKLINKIYNNNFPLTEEQKDLKNCLEMIVEKSIEKYYDSNDFQIFKNRKDIKYYDKMFYKERERNFSLLEKGGFYKLVNMPYYCHNPK